MSISLRQFNFSICPSFTNEFSSWFTLSYPGISYDAFISLGFDFQMGAIMIFFDRNKIDLEIYKDLNKVGNQWVISIGSTYFSWNDYAELSTNGIIDIHPNDVGNYAYQASFRYRNDALFVSIQYAMYQYYKLKNRFNPDYDKSSIVDIDDLYDNLPF